MNSPIQLLHVGTIVRNSVSASTGTCSSGLAATGSGWLMPITGISPPCVTQRRLTDALKRPVRCAAMWVR